ncbi:MAG: diaminopimelate epimerase [Spiribacter sp.]|nr:diaminopimelate epimerase [Spiribacter sp.]MDR9489371.1 diaminopimelate epimerase [Spiribacter sp.]
MNFRFVKMQGLGNDFVVIDGVRQSLALSSEQIRWLADRRLGIGCDQVLMAEPSARADADFRYRIWNADGSEVEHCGNGVRCLAQFLYNEGLIEKTPLTLHTQSGLTRVSRLANGEMQVDMGTPILAPHEIPFRANEQALSYPLVINDQTYPIAAVSMGNPHAVMRVESVATAAVTTLGPAIANHPDFPAQANAGFMEVVDRGHIRLRVFERGVGETPACGTGACAAVVAGVLNGWLESNVQVDLSGGSLVIHWQGDETSVWMTGPAQAVFEGRLAAGAS